MSEENEPEISREKLLESANMVAEVLSEAVPLVNQLVASLESGTLEEVREDVAAVREQMKSLRSDKLHAWFNAMHVRKYHPLVLK